MKYTEEEILISLQTDREQGAAILMEQYAGLLWSVCQNRLEDPEDIKECVNSTFADVCLHPEKYHAEKGSLKNYLCIIADRKAIDRYYENSRHRQAEEALLERKKEAQNVSNSDAMAEYLEEALEQLEPIDSQILRMKYYDGMTYQEIAAQLGLSEGTVKMRSLRSRKKLFKILIVVLILALLAACAVAVLHRYQFSQRGGVNWSGDVNVYELAEGEITWEKNNVRYVIHEAEFRLADSQTMEGELSVYLVGYWLGEETEEWNYEFSQAVTAEMELLNVSGEPRDNRHILSTHYASGGYANGFSMLNSAEKEVIEFEIFMEPVLDSKEQDLVKIPIYLNTEVLTELVLRPAEFREFEVSDEKITLLNGSKWSLGPAVAGDRFTIVSMLGTRGNQEWVLSTTLCSSRYCPELREKTPITLTGEDGTVYSVIRAGYEGDMVEDERKITQYDLYFMGVAPGEYQLDIPAFYYMKDWQSESFTLALPEEENVYTECDVIALFPDGNGFHVTGITKQEFIYTSYHQEPGSEELRMKQTYYWEYILDMERITKGEPELIMALTQYADGAEMLNSISTEGIQSFKILQGEEPAEVTICFSDPEYFVQHDFSWNVTVEAFEQESAEAEQ